MDALKLAKPVMINNKEYREFKFDFDNMTAQDKLNAGKAYKKAGNVISVQELDCDYHLYIFAQAVSKENPEIDPMEVLRMGAKDAARAEKKVRDFFFLDSEDTSQMNTSEEQQPK
jgi:hypothetical protein